MQEPNTSIINQLYDWCVNVVPHFSNDFTDKYPIRTLTYDIANQTAIATLDPADITTLNNTGDKRFVITNAEQQINIVNATILTNLTILITFDRVIDIQINSQQMLQGFLPVAYNTSYMVVKRTNGDQYEFTPTDWTILNNPITSIGYFTKYAKCKGWNGLKTTTINTIENTITYPLDPQSIIGLNAYSRDLGDGYGVGCGFIHNYHINILLGTYHNYRDYYSQKKDYLFINSTDFNIRVNQEKNNIIDTPDRQDGRTGNFARVIMSFYVVYVKNVTREVAKSTNLNKVMDLYNILYKISGIPITIQAENNPNTYYVYQLALGDVAPMADSDGMLFNTYQYTFTTTINYSVGNLLADDVWSDYAVNNANLDILPNVSTELTGLYNL